MRAFRAGFAALALPLGAACVPPGNSTPSVSEAGAAAAQPTFRPSPGVMTSPFQDDFERRPVSPAVLMPEVVMLGRLDGARPEAMAPVLATAPAEGGALEIGADWTQTPPKPGLPPAWRIENGRLCGQNAYNHGIWLNRVLPPNARIEFDAITESPQGDLKAEVWGDGQSGATGVSYTNATSYLTIFGGWRNSLHVLARINEHGDDRRAIKVTGPAADDPRERPVARGQVYRFKIERADGRTVRWFVDGIEMLSWADEHPLVGLGHDHFGFNDWEVKVCFDNVKVTPLL